MLHPAVKEKAAKFDYEYMGLTPAELSQRYGYPIPLLETWITTWTRKVEPSVQTATTLQDLVQQRLQIVGLYRQMEHEPLIAHLERCIIEKALEVVDQLQATDDKTPRKLNDLLVAMRAIQSRDPVQIGIDQPASAGVIVQIQNNLS